MQFHIICSLQYSISINKFLVEPPPPVRFTAKCCGKTQEYHLKKIFRFVYGASLGKFKLSKNEQKTSI